MFLHQKNRLCFSDRIRQSDEHHRTHLQAMLGFSDYITYSVILRPAALMLAPCVLVEPSPTRDSRRLGPVINSHSFTVVLLFKRWTLLIPRPVLFLTSVVQLSMTIRTLIPSQGGSRRLSLRYYSMLISRSKSSSERFMPYLFCIFGFRMSSLLCWFHPIALLTLPYNPPLKILLCNS